MKVYFSILILPVFLLLAGCSSTEEAKKPAPPKNAAREKDPEESAWNKFMAKQKDEERSFHRMDSRQLDHFQVYPWRDGEKRRSQQIYERRDKSVFTDGWW